MANESFSKIFTIKNLIFLIVLILLIIFAFSNKDITLMLFASFVIACSLNPLVDKLSTKIKRSIASGIVLFLFILALFVFILPLIFIGIQQISLFADALPGYANNINDYLSQSQTLINLGINKSSIIGFLSSILNNLSKYFSSAVVVVKGFGSALVYIIISTIFTYFFMADKDKVGQTFLRFFPTTMRDRVQEITSIIAKKMGGYITAQAYSIASVGIVMTIGLMLFRVDYAILLGLITAISDLIPVLGPFMALIICVLATYEGGIIPVVGVFLSFAAAQLIENNVVRPYAFSKLLNVHPLLIFLFLFIAAKYFGVVGALFAPAIAAFVCVIIEELYMKNIE